MSKSSKSLKLFTFFGIIFTLTLGTLGHFFYEWSGNNYVVGLFFATNESAWEHIKLALFPMFLYFIIAGVFVKGINNYFAGFFLAMLSVILLIPAMFYGYTAIVGKSIIAIDIAIFVLSVIIGFLVAMAIFKSQYMRALNFLSIIGIAVIIICFMTFTYNPPDWIIFDDPTK